MFIMRHSPDHVLLLLCSMPSKHAKIHKRYEQHFERIIFLGEGVHAHVCRATFGLCLFQYLLACSACGIHEHRRFVVSIFMYVFIAYTLLCVYFQLVHWFVDV